MIKLKCLASGSSGNCYLLSSESEKLILDCGISVSEIKKGLGFNLSKVAGVLCSHGHSDHNKALDNFVDMGMRVMAPFEAGDVKRAHCQIGSFDIISFDLPHNGIWNSGFLIKAEGQKILYMTDFEYCPYVFKKQRVNHILIECNYQQEYVSYELAQYEHKIRGHCSLDTCKKFIGANATDALKTVILLHMGAETCDPLECVAGVRKVAGNGVYVDWARKGLEVELRNGSECPF